MIIWDVLWIQSKNFICENTKNKGLNNNHVYKWNNVLYLGTSAKYQLILLEYQKYNIW